MIIETIKKGGRYVAVAAGTSVASFSALADGVNPADHTAIINAAKTVAQTNVTTTIAAVIGVTAIAFGAGLVIAWMRR